jgi:hypothetical protein
LARENSHRRRELPTNLCVSTDGEPGVTVGGFVGETAQELGRDFGRPIAGAESFLGDDCGL